MKGLKKPSHNGFHVIVGYRLKTSDYFRP